MLRRWAAVVAAPLVFLSFLLGMALLYGGSSSSELAQIIHLQLTSPFVQRFALSLVLREILPLYLLAGLLLWVLALAWGLLPAGLGWRWREAWTWRHGLLGTWGLLGTLHLVLWWKVPTTLWVLPGLARLPFWLAFLVLVLVTLGPLAWMAMTATRSWGRRGFVLAGWVCLPLGLALLPGWISSRPPVTEKGSVKVLALSLDGMRADTPEIERLEGLRFPNAYTSVPATRLQFSLLWGGDPEHYSVGHVFPDLEELQGRRPFVLLERLKRKGGKARFFIDDGGTIGLADRTDAFDRVEMPARGWENFFNSNLAAHVPLYASWLDVLRIFPSTHPWTPLDAGLRKALERGKGADLVLFHSCLTHQPIFLTRDELGEIPGWWTMAPGDFVPIFFRGGVTEDYIRDWDPRKSPLSLYRIRTRHILEAWAGVWNGLAKDPSYQGAYRVFFSDHGKRFYHVTEAIEMGGVHGFDVDPWQTRIPFVLAGPGIANGSGPEEAVSLHGLRDAIGDHLLKAAPFSIETLRSYPFAPIRYHTLSTEDVRPTGKRYFELKAENVLTSLNFGPNGSWYMTYDRPASLRGQEVTVARAQGDELVVLKPLLGGGAHKLEYKGYRMVRESEIPEEAFLREKKEIERLYFRVPFWAQP